MSTTNNKLNFDNQLTTSNLALVNFGTNQYEISKKIIIDYWTQIQIQWYGQMSDICLNSLIPTLEYCYISMFENIYPPEDFFNFFIQKNNEIVGLCLLFQDNDLKEIFVRDLVILPEFRNQGYGSQILQLIVDKAKQIDFDQIGLWVDVANKGALNLYFKNGFAKASDEIINWINQSGAVVHQSQHWYCIKKISQNKLKISQYVYNDS